MNKLMEFLRDEEGATAIEYGLIVGLVAVIIITAFALFGTGLTNVFTSIGNKLTNEGTAVTGAGS